MFGACSRRSQKDKKHKTSPDLIALDHSRGMCPESMNGVDAQCLPNRNSHGCTYTCMGLPQQQEELHNLYFTPVLVWCVPSCPGYKQGPPDLHSVASLLHQLHSHWSPPSEFGFPAEKDNRGFISCENPPQLTPGDNQPSCECEIIKTDS